MAKVANKYYQIDPWSIIEVGFNPERSLVSESIFALGNEYIGVRGYFDEAYSDEKLIGSYINDVYESIELDPRKVPGMHYKGISNRSCFMINTLNWLSTHIEMDGEELDLSQSKFSDFRRILNLKTGELVREFIWETISGKRTKIVFRRFVNMKRNHLAGQKISFEALNHQGTIRLKAGLDFSILHFHSDNYWNILEQSYDGESGAILGQTHNSKVKLFAAFHLGLTTRYVGGTFEEEKQIGHTLEFVLQQGVVVDFEKVVYLTNIHEENPHFFEEASAEFADLSGENYGSLLDESAAFWASIWKKSDIVIDGSDEDQQGIRYCIFQLNQTYLGTNPNYNIGAKGLTGEAYSGHAFWDTETGCLPYYLFNNIQAAKYLLLFRYKGLEAAKERAKQLDCIGACYPIATKDGTESCMLWQHASTQFQPSTAVAFGIRHYYLLTKDKEFLNHEGLEMLIEICRFLGSRGQWSQKTHLFGYFSVMGPDEFQLMVNNNMYTNFMAQQTFLFTLECLKNLKVEDPAGYEEMLHKTQLQEAEIIEFENKATHMKILKGEEGLFEQHEGFFDLPHIDVNSIDVKDFPLYSHWSYDRIYRNDMIKQPDVLMFMFLYSSMFTKEEKKVNFDFYEPRCIHESSLSPAIHSIMASEIGYHDMASKFFEFATRLDLDDYNRNANEGLHITSIAMAWMNIVYGFGGMRSDGEKLTFRPTIPKAWNMYQFSIFFQGSVVRFTITSDKVKVELLEGNPVSFVINDQEHQVDENGLTLELLNA